MARRSGYAVAAQTRFSGGLNLVDGADVVGADQASDLMNVLFLPRGGLRQRDGYQRLTATELTNRVDSLAAYYTSGGARQLLVGNGLRLDALNSGGTSIANVATTAAGHAFARFGAPGSEHVYIANGVDTVRRWDGAAFSTPAYTGTTPTHKLLAVQAVDNRLVAARTVANPDRVSFSDPGVPTTFGANNYVDLHPGSGEPVTALVAWREYVFAFKETEFFVFYGTSTSGTGTPVFNFRPVSTGTGSLGPVCVAPEGVYFMDRRGVWLTTGGPAKLVSGALDPLFLGGPSLYYTGGTAATATLATSRMWWSQGRLYVAFAVGATNDRLAVYSPRDDWWGLFNIPVGAVCSFRSATREELVFGYAAGLKHIGRYFEGSGLRADDALVDASGGVAVSSHWRQGWVDYGDPNIKHLRETKLWGEGAAQFAVARDYALAPSSYTPATFSASASAVWDGGGVWDSGLVWGPAAVTRPWLMSQSASGHVLALMIRNSTLNQTWALHSVAHGFKGSRGHEVVGQAG